MPANISYFTHFSGNFWWTRADYWHSLADTIGPDYYDPNASCSPASRAPRASTTRLPGACSAAVRPDAVQDTCGVSHYRLRWCCLS